MDETVEKIGQQMFCQKRKLGRPYPVCLRNAGYLDHAFPLPTDDPQYRPPGPYQEDWAGTLDDERDRGREPVEVVIRMSSWKRNMKKRLRWSMTV